MRKKLIPEDTIINLSKDIIQGFYNRNIDDSIQYLSDDFMWIGAFDFQYTTSKEQFLDVIKSELGATPFSMINEEFFVLSKSSSTYVVCAKFQLVAQVDENTVVNTHTRLTIIWKYEGDDLKVFHIHGSNAQDIPLSISGSKAEYSSDKDFFSYLVSLNNCNTNNKISFRDISGKYRYFLENEIVYLEANLQSTYLYTINECIQISGLLAKNAKKLPDKFYRIHKTYVVNTAFVVSLERYKVTLINQKQLPVSKEKYIAFRESNQLD